MSSNPKIYDKDGNEILGFGKVVDNSRFSERSKMMFPNGSTVLIARDRHWGFYVAENMGVGCFGGLGVGEAYTLTRPFYSG